MSLCIFRGEFGGSLENSIHRISDRDNMFELRLHSRAHLHLIQKVTQPSFRARIPVSLSSRPHASDSLIVASPQELRRMLRSLALSQGR